MATNAATMLTDLVQSLYTVRQQKTALEKTEKAILEQLKSQVDPVFDDAPESAIPISVGGLQLSRVAGTSRTISADKLLERGVAPDVIAYATKTSAYFQYRVREAKQDE